MYVGKPKKIKKEEKIPALQDAGLFTR